MAEEIRFVSGQTPSLLYATKQFVAASTVTRAIHRHERFTEMLYVYQGAGQYIAGGYSYPIRTGDILLYNQGDLHEVTSSLQHEIGTFCFGISGLQLRGLPEGHFTRAENGFVRPAMDEIDHIQALSEMIYEHAERRTSCLLYTSLLALSEVFAAQRTLDDGLVSCPVEQVVDEHTGQQQRPRYLLSLIHI